jgi:hypothetical protein
MRQRIGALKIVREVLQDHVGSGMTISELLDRADIPKFRANDFSSALVRLLAMGRVQVVERPATSRMGRRIVRSYLWIPLPPTAEVEEVEAVVVVEVVKVVVEPPRPNPMAALGIFRI